MYSNNIVNVQESTTILNACTKKCGNLLKPPHTHTYIYIYLSDIIFDESKWFSEKPIHNVEDSNIPSNLRIVLYEKP